MRIARLSIDMQKALREMEACKAMVANALEYISEVTRLFSKAEKPVLCNYNGALESGFGASIFQHGIAGFDENSVSDMNKSYEFESERLGFRRWEAKDRIPFYRMNADSNVMRYFPHTLSKAESDIFLDKIMNHFQEHGYGLWAVELKQTHEFIGFIGLYKATFKSDFTPCVEIGWRLDNRFWNMGYATEGAKRVLEYGFKVLELKTIYSFTSEMNKPSIHVMKKIGLKEQGSFQHPNIEERNPLRQHVLYKLEKQTYDTRK